MLENCTDVFKNYELPFETYFATCIDHPSDVHEEMELIWLIAGNAIVQCEGKEFYLTNQTIFMIYMNRRHAIKSSEGSIIISYRFKKEHLLKNKLMFQNIPFVHRVYTFQELSNKYHEVPLLISQILKLLISETPSPIIRYKILGYYNLFLYELYNMMQKEKYLDFKKTNYDPYLVRINTLIEYIHDHAHEKISLEMLAEKANISTFRLSHFIKESLGISFSEFLQNTRFEYSLKCLKETDLSIYDVAKSSGFSDVKYLNKMLKDRYNMTALKYRKRLTSICTQESQPFFMTDFIEELRVCLKLIEVDQPYSATYGLNPNV